MKIGFIGLGKLGMPCAEEIAKKGHAVLGYDVDKSLNSDYVIVEDTIKDVASEADIVLLQCLLHMIQTMTAKHLQHI